MRLIDADALKKTKVYSEERREYIVAVFNIDNAPTVEERPHGECKTCSHRDPEDKKCDCGGLERIGCQFPVSDDYYCKYYERMTCGADMREVVKNDK